MADHRCGHSLICGGLHGNALGKELLYEMVGWLWYVGTLVPVIGIVQIGSHCLTITIAFEIYK